MYNWAIIMEGAIIGYLGEARETTNYIINGWMGLTVSE